MVNYGYCCINLTLDKQGIKIGRGMIKRTFQAKGIEYAGELAESNVRDMVEIIKWNNQHGIKMYRMSSNLFPWMSEYEFSDLPNWPKIKNLLKGAGTLAMKYGQRITFHPGQFNILTSEREDVVLKTLKELRQHGEIMDAMGLPRTHEAPINIHAGGTYGDKPSAIKRFITNFHRLDECVKSRLVLENDDKPAQYGVEDLYEIWQSCVTPITFDYHHHRCYNDPMPEREALELAATTWPKGIRQLCHYSSAKKLYEDASVIMRAHADYVYEPIEDYGMELDIEIEAKAKELAVQKYVKQFREVLI